MGACCSCLQAEPAPKGPMPENASPSGSNEDVNNGASMPHNGVQIDWASADPTVQKTRAEKEIDSRMRVDEERWMYECCPDGVKGVDDIPPWGARGETDPPSPPRLELNMISDREVEDAPHAQGPYDSELNRRVSLLKADITGLMIDAIVNAANSQLQDGSGVTGAIFCGAGPWMKQECAMLKGCEVGQAKVTLGYRLPAASVIHTVGPQNGNESALVSCYTSCLDMVKAHRFRTVAFPCLATGVYGYPLEEAATVAVSTVRSWMEQERHGYLTTLDRIIFCVYDDEALRVYKELLEVYFPVSTHLPDIMEGDIGNGNMAHGGMPQYLAKSHG